MADAELEHRDELVSAEATRTRARPSMADVGLAANVSAQTVSRYFTGGYVGSETRTRIQSAVETLGYRHNRVARNLRVNRTDSVGVLTMGPLNYGNSTMLTGLNAAARVAGISLVTTQLDVDTTEPSSLDEIEQALDHLLAFQVDGIIVGTPFLGTERLLDRIGRDTPVVTLVGIPPADDLTHSDFVSVDSYSAGLTATRHLLNLGHRRVLHVAGPVNRIEALQRARGYHDAMAEVGLPPLPVLECAEWTADAGAKRARDAPIGEFTAVFAANDLIALGVMHQLRRSGLRAPDDYSIIGVDDMPEVAYYSPTLSSVRLDFVDLGRLALQVLQRHIATGRPQPREVIQPRLVMRESTTTPG